MGYVGIKGIFTPSIAPIEEKTLPFKATLLALLKVWPVVLLMLVAVGPIYLGLCTPPEGAGVGGLGAIVIGSVFGKLNWQGIKASLRKTTETSALIFFVVVGAMLVSDSVSTVGAPRSLVLWVGSLALSPTVIFILISLMYIIMGCFIDSISLTLVTVPFIAPLLSSLGFDLVWFGVMLVLLIEIGLVTPPVGLNLFVIQGIGGPKTAVSDIFLGSFPFLLIALAMMGLTAAFPGIATFLPRAIGF